MEEPPLPDASTVALGPLSRDAVGELLEARHGLRGRTLLDTVWEKAGGNPLFTIELAELLADHASGDAELDPEALPDRIQGLLMSRVDQLSGPVRDVLTCAAVLGAEFDEDLLADLADTPDPSPALDELRRARLVRPAGRGRHVFLQNLLQDVAYESLAFFSALLGPAPSGGCQHRARVRRRPRPVPGRPGAAPPARRRPTAHHPVRGGGRIPRPTGCMPTPRR